MATLQRIAPPRRASGVRWCELGCGQGVTAAIVAATHPAVEVHGVDAIGDHIDQARRFAGRAGIANATFHHALFGAQQLDALPQFEYIVAHGVYSWVDGSARAQLRAFIDRHLAPGGLVYVSYNAMPGRAADVPLQRLLFEVAARCDGDSGVRFAAAVDVAQRASDAGAGALLAEPIERAGFAKASPERTAYYPHEFLPASWEPRYVTDVRNEMASIGLEPAGSAIIRNNFDSYTIGERGRAMLATVDDLNLRELLRDYFRRAAFRRDVFSRGASRLEDSERREALLATTFHLNRPAELVEYRTQTPAGELAFDSPLARRVVSALAAGPKRLAALGEPQSATKDLIAVALALCAGNAIRPVSDRPVPVARLNALIESAGWPGFTYRVSPFGTALIVERDAAQTPASPVWGPFLHAHGMDASLPPW